MTFYSFPPDFGDDHMDSYFLKGWDLAKGPDHTVSKITFWDGGKAHEKVVGHWDSKIDLTANLPITPKVLDVLKAQEKAVGDIAKKIASYLPPISGNLLWMPPSLMESTTFAANPATTSDVSIEDLKYTLASLKAKYGEPPEPKIQWVKWWGQFPGPLPFTPLPAREGVLREHRIHELLERHTKTMEFARTAVDTHAAQAQAEWAAPDFEPDWPDLWSSQ